MNFEPSTLVTDRTNEDVLNQTAKGSYNADDLNRVGAAMQYIADRFAAYGYQVSISPKTDWAASGYLSTATAGKYLADLAVLRAALTVLTSTPNVPPDMDGLTYTEANDIEQILKDIDMLLTNAEMAWYRSGDLYAGEV